MRAVLGFLALASPRRFTSNDLSLWYILLSSSRFRFLLSTDCGTDSSSTVSRANERKPICSLVWTLAVLSTLVASLALPGCGFLNFHIAFPSRHRCVVASNSALAAPVLRFLTLTRRSVLFLKRITLQQTNTGTEERTLGSKPKEKNERASKTRTTWSGQNTNGAVRRTFETGRQQSRHRPCTLICRKGTSSCRILMMIQWETGQHCSLYSTWWTSPLWRMTYICVSKQGVRRPKLVTQFKNMWLDLAGAVEKTALAYNHVHHCRPQQLTKNAPAENE